MPVFKFSRGGNILRGSYLMELMWLLVCHFLSRLALSSHAFATLLGIKNAVHKRKLSVKASDLVLFGPPKCMLRVIFWKILWRHLTKTRTVAKISILLYLSFMLINRIMTYCRREEHTTFFRLWRFEIVFIYLLVLFLSASLYFSKRGAYWDRLCRDVVGRWSLVVGHWLVGWLSRACTVAKRCILGL